MKSLDICFGLVSILQYHRSLLTKILNRLHIIGQPDTVILTVEESLLHYSINPQEQHPTHWILIARAAGFDDASENGYVVVGWSKRVFKIDHVRMLCKIFSQAMFGGSTDLRLRAIDINPSGS